MIHKITFCFIVLVSLAGKGYTQVPGTLSYQGILLQTDGSAIVDGAHSIVFNFYTVSSGGVATITRTISVTTSKGLYTCIIGDATSGNAALPATVGSQQFYIGIAVDGGSELAPRARLTTSPYSFQAQSAYAISYAAPKTKYLNISNTAFQITTTSTGDVQTNSNRILNSGGAYALTIFAGMAYSAVYLPDGATITAFEASIYMDPTYGSPMTVRLMRQLSGSNAPATLATVTNVSGNNSTPSTSTITTPVVDNQNYSYQLVVEVPVNFASLYSVKITYTVTTPD